MANAAGDRDDPAQVQATLMMPGNPHVPVHPADGTPFRTRQPWAHRRVLDGKTNTPVAHHPVASKRLTPCVIGLAVEDEVVDSKSVTPAKRRDADEPEGSQGDVAAIAAAVHGTRPREGRKRMIDEVCELLGIQSQARDQALGIPIQQGGDGRPLFLARGCGRTPSQGRLVIVSQSSPMTSAYRARGFSWRISTARATLESSACPMIGVWSGIRSVFLWA